MTDLEAIKLLALTGAEIYLRQLEVYYGFASRAVTLSWHERCMADKAKAPLQPKKGVPV